MSLDLDLAERLRADLDRIIIESTETLKNALPFEQYQQSCGMIEAYRQVRDSLIPTALEELQRR